MTDATGHAATATIARRLGAWLLSALLMGAAPPPTSPPRVAPSGDGQARLKVGEVMEIALPANASTGYAWEFVQDGAPLLRRVPANPAPRTRAADAAPPVVGAGTTQRWWFQAVAPGDTELQLIYRRPWEKTAPARRAVYRVRVDAAAAAVK